MSNHSFSKESLEEYKNTAKAVGALEFVQYLQKKGLLLTDVAGELINPRDAYTEFKGLENG